MAVSEEESDDCLIHQNGFIRVNRGDLFEIMPLILLSGT